MQTDAEYFDQFVNDHGAFNPFTDAGWRKLKIRFQRLSVGRHFESMLDIGCGTGMSRQLYIDQVDAYTGIDLSENAIKVAEKTFPDDQWLARNACDTQLDSESYDLIAFSSVIHHIDDKQRALQEAMRMLKPGGMVFAYDPNVYHPAMALLRHPASPIYNPVGVSPNEKPLRPGYLREMFNQAGFKSIEQEVRGGIAYRQLAIKKLGIFLKTYNLVDKMSASLRLDYFNGSFVITSGQKATA